ncbi:hypothetical protein CBS147347_2202 [Aspergillus niger]|nr:hypothetical protein CBS147347_2202 [Aspergillus niger]
MLIAPAQDERARLGPEEAAYIATGTLYHPRYSPPYPSFIILLHIPLLAEDKNTFYIIMPSKLALGRAGSIE